MAFTTMSSVLALLLCLLFPATIAAPNQTSSTPAAPASHAKACKPFYPIIAFGDSATDTGNQIRSAMGFAPALHPPYGITFFRRPTGRYSDGRLLIDFLASALHERFVPPHLARRPLDDSQNFAAAGATALDGMTLHHLANLTSFTSQSLPRQIEGFLYDTFRTDLTHSLVYFGEIGAAEIHYAIAARQSPATIAKLVDPIQQSISTALHFILKRGVKNIVVEGQFPIGCFPLYLKALNGTKTDKHGCIKSIMHITERQNSLLKASLTTLATEYKHANIVFFDSTAAYLDILHHAKKLNFTNVHDACFTRALEMVRPAPHQPAGMPRPHEMKVKVCPNPHNYVSWDGVHLTDAMHGAMMKLFLTESKYTTPFPNFLTNCTMVQ